MLLERDSNLVSSAVGPNVSLAVEDVDARLEVGQPVRLAIKACSFRRLVSPATGDAIYVVLVRGAALATAG